MKKEDVLMFVSLTLFILGMLSFCAGWVVFTPCVGSSLAQIFVCVGGGCMLLGVVSAVISGLYDC